MASRMLVPTRIQVPLRTYLKAYAKAHGRNLDDLAEEIIARFLELKPYERGLAWRTPTSHRSAQGMLQDWKQVNLYLTSEIVTQLIGVEHHTGRSRAELLYTALFWFARYMRPPLPLPSTPPQEKKRRSHAR